MDEFFTWQILGTFAGASLATGIITQALDKLLNKAKKIPTQLIATLTALVVLLTVHIFTGGLSVSNVVLSVFNAVLVASATSGAISGVRRMMK